MPDRNGTRVVGFCHHCHNLVFSHQHSYRAPDGGPLYHFRCRIALELERRGERVPPHLLPPRWWET
jgi:hypothetical protein